MAFHCIFVCLVVLHVQCAVKGFMKTKCWERIAGTLETFEAAGNKSNVAMLSHSYNSSSTAKHWFYYIIKLYSWGWTQTWDLWVNCYLCQNKTLIMFLKASDMVEITFLVFILLCLVQKLYSVWTYSFAFSLALRKGNVDACFKRVFDVKKMLN